MISKGTIKVSLQNHVQYLGERNKAKILYKVFCPFCLLHWAFCWNYFLKRNSKLSLFQIILIKIKF